MDIMDIITRMGGLQSMAGELNISAEDAARGSEALLPAILGGFKKQTHSQPGGLEGLGGLLGQLGGGALADDVLAPRPTNVDRGNEVLGQIFGEKDVSRAVAQNAASQSGLDPSLLKKMLPMLAMLVAGFMAKQGSALPAAEPAAEEPSAAGGGLGALGGLGGLGGLLGGLLGGESPRATDAPPEARTQGLAAMLDLNGDGNPLDDILNMVGKALR